MIKPLFASILCLLSYTASAADGPRAQPAAAVTVATVTAKAMPLDLKTIGRVRAIATVPLRSRIDGLITHVMVADGQPVKAGDVLFQIDDRALQATLRQAKAQLARDQAQLTNAKADIKRQTSLASRKIVSQSTLDQATATADALTATVAGDQALVDLAKVQLSYTTITAPMDGQLGTINSKAGTWVKAGDATPLVVLNQLSPIYVNFAVSQDNFARIRAGMAKGNMPVAISLPGDDGPPITGKLAYIENTIDADSNTISLNAVVDNPDHRLWPGLFVDARLTLAIEEQAIVIPAQAVQAGQNGDFVFVISADNKAHVRPIVVSRTVDGVSIIKDGLTINETVVTTGQIRLQDGSMVEIQKTVPPS